MGLFTKTRDDSDDDFERAEQDNMNQAIREKSHWKKILHKFLLPLMVIVGAALVIG